MYNTYYDNIYLLYDFGLASIRNSFTVFQLFSVDVWMDSLGLCAFLDE